ncbi:protein of unknown function [Cupriavidus taiwanensis]|nr:protein of unknown function [Cupriavidus taiwanensis]
MLVRRLTCENKHTICRFRRLKFIENLEDIFFGASRL